MQENRNSLHLDSEKDISTKNDADIIYSTLKEICENVEKFIKNQAKSIPKWIKQIEESPSEREIQ